MHRTGAATPGLTTAVLDGILRSQREIGGPTPYSCTNLDVELLTAADAALATRTPLAVVYSLATPATPVILAAAAIVAAVSTARSARVQVAVAATKLGAATVYSDLRLRDVPLAQLVARTRVTADGTPGLPSARLRAAPGRLHLTGSLDRLGALLADLDALVIDSSATTPAALSSFLTRAVDGDRPRPGVLYVTTSPMDPALDVVRGVGGLVWAWDPPAAAALADRYPGSAPAAAPGVPLTTPTDLLASAAAAHIQIRVPPANSLDAALSRLWRALGALVDSYSATSQAARTSVAAATRWAWHLYHVGALLPVAPDVYDRHAPAVSWLAVSRLAEAPATARAFARTQTGMPAQAWYRVAEAFIDLLDAGQGQDKLGMLIEWVTGCVASQQPAALLLGNQTAIAAVAAALDESPLVPDQWHHIVILAQPRDATRIALAKPLARVCVPGTLPARSSGLWNLPPAPEVSILAAGPDQAARAVAAIRTTRTRAGELRWETTSLTSELLGITPRTDTTAQDALTGVSMNQDGTLRPVPDVAELEAWNPFDVDIVAELADIVTTSGDLEPPPPVRRDGEDTVTQVAAVVVHVRDLHSPHGSAAGRMLLLDPADVVTRRRGHRAERVAAKSLTAGDVLALVDRSARADLLTSVIAKLAESPAYATLSLLVQFWHLRAARVRHLDLTYSAILRRMHGTAITSPGTIGTWVRGEVDGPLDKTDVARFAAAVDDQDLAAQANQVGWAMDTLHRVHRKVGAWLSARLDGAALAPGDATVDAALDIGIADLLDAVSLHEVTAVDVERTVVPVSLLGVLLTQEQLTGAV
ncbi:hypothetical protein AB0F43_30920 [Kribbella sp. NPDC023972]|uniref:DISARM anti-phage system protein DrmE domain-containing protein n=1 Tax=Kribbella sp. NPDC023972 TaxID=3154795 RepID=UPI0033C4C3DA